MKKTPSQNEIDQLAAYLEATEELKNEPYFHPDENRSVQSQGNKFTFVMGDRFHFRSALVTFRRIWMKNEPSNFHSCSNILWQFNPEIQPGLLQSWRGEVKRITHEKVTLFQQTTGQSGPTNEEIINLWLYAVFAHVSVGRNGDKRKKFELCLKTFGQAPMEYAFRMAIFWLSLPYKNMSDHNVRPFLAYWWNQGLKPSFEIGAPFGIKSQETTPDGHTMIRKSSSKFFNEETFEKMVERVSSRNRYSNLKFVVDHLEMSNSEKIKVLTLADTIEEIIGNAGKAVALAEVAPNTFPLSGQGPRAFTTLFEIQTGRKAGAIIDETGLHTSQIGVDILNESLKQLKSDIRKEALES
jgi:hypothetical protein